ncbi:MAG: ABC transporter ATP-binding protein, partial [Jatrophihabitans sp.]
TERSSGSAFLAACRLAFRTSPISFVVIILAGVAAGSVLAPAAVLTKHLINDLADEQARRHAGTLVLLAVLIAVLTALGKVTTSLAGIPAYRLAGRVRVVTETELARACARFPGTEALDDPAVQDRLGLAREGAHDGPAMVASTIVGTFSSCSQIGGFVGVLWATSPAMLGVLLATVIPLVLLRRAATARSLRYTELASTAYRWRDYYTALFNTPAPARDMRLYGAQEDLLGRLRHHLRTAVRLDVRRSTLQSLTQLVFVLLDAAIAGGGAAWVVWQIAHDRLSIGDFLLFTSAVAAVQTAIAGLLYALMEVGLYGGIFARYLDLIALAEAAQATGGNTPAPPLRHGIEFSDVWFRYPGSADWVLRGLNLRLTAGEFTALIGLNGAGKSSLVNLLLRFYHPHRGQIRWDGIDIATFEPASLRARIAGVLQEHTNFELTALDNVLIGYPDGTPEQARQAADAAGVLEAIERLPHGLQTMLSPRRANDEGKTGSSLSGGQWQRIALARALLRSDRDLLVLDEANARLDVSADAALNRLLHSLTNTRLVISHRLRGVRDADLIYLIADGVVIEQGDHQRLMANEAEYARLVAGDDLSPAQP